MVAVHAQSREQSLPLQPMAQPSQSPLPPAAGSLGQEQLIREQQRQQELQERLQPRPDVRLDSGPAEGQSALGLGALQPDGQACFAIEEVKLVGEEAARFQFALRNALFALGFQEGMCLGVQGINAILAHTQNTIIERGYTTTRILTAPQDLKSGVLELTVLPGRIGRIRYEQEGREHTHVGRIMAFQNEFPAQPGEILNLRALEQGLENLKRLPTAEADIQIAPGEQPNESDVVIVWQQRLLPYRLSMNVDDSGSHATGKYQGGITFSADNPMGLSDMFYVNVNRDLGSKTRLTDATGDKTSSGTNGYALHYSVPFGNWLFAANRSRYRYHQAIAGLQENYDYNGKSTNSDVGLTRMLQRSASSKTSVTGKLWRRQSNNFINDTEIDVQRRRTGGWQLGIEHRHYIGAASVSAGATYKQGTGMGSSLPAPEEAFGEGTSRMKIVTADASVYAPFAWGQQRLSFDSSVHAQWNKTPLVVQDRLSIGGRYTVRGFNGELTLMGERGWYARNNLTWHYLQGHQAYVGLDVGHVAGPSTQYQLGKNLAGAVIGFKGQLPQYRDLQIYYDVFVGTPVHKPQHFKTPKTTVGFSLNMAF